MEKREQELIISLLEKDPELKKFFKENQELEKKLQGYQRKPYLTPLEALEKRRLQKLKLIGKDKIMEILGRHRQAGVQAAIETESGPQWRDAKQKNRKKWTKNALREYLLEKGIANKGCPGLDSLIGPVKGPVDMKRVLRIGKKLSGLTRQIIADREDRM